MYGSRQQQGGASNFRSRGGSFWKNIGRGKLIKISNSNSSEKSVKSPRSKECALNLKGTVTRTKTKGFFKRRKVEVLSSEMAKTDHL